MLRVLAMALLAYIAPPTLARFMRSAAFVRCVVGPVGSGKSSSCVVELLRRAAEQKAVDGVRRSRFVVIRNTYPELRDTTRKTFEQWVPESLGRWHEQGFTFEIDQKLSDGTRIASEILFRALDRPQDVKKLLSLELTGAYVNEAREVPRHVFDVLQTRVGRYPSKAQGGPSWFGVWMDTNPWPVGHWGHELFSMLRPEGHDLFEQPDGLSKRAENIENLPAGYYDRLCIGKDDEWVDEYIRAKYPRADKASIFGRQLAALEARGGVCDFEHPRDGVFATFDLGVDDSTSIWWWRFNKHRMPDLLDWYEAAGEGAEHYFGVLEERGYKLRQIYLPHDARARTFQTGISTIEQFIKKFGRGMVSITPELGLADGLSAARWLLGQPMRIHSRCAEGVKRLRAYKRQWDEEKKVYSNQPVHDWASNTADGLRYVACVVQVADQSTAEEEPKKAATPKQREYTFDELCELADNDEPGRERV